MRLFAPALLIAQLGLPTLSSLAAPASADLRVASVVPAPEQPSLQDEAVIFHENFDHLPDWPTRFFEYSNGDGSFVWTPTDGLQGGAMRCRFEKGQVDAGSLKVVFGRNPFHRGIKQEQVFQDIYWRVYVKHESGWQGNPAKLARATCLASAPNWSQGFIAHVWGGKGEVLCIDPATGIRDSQKVTTRYNDFANLKWLGVQQAQTPIFSQAESGRWICVESRVKINSPGAKDGIFELFVDGKLEAARNDLDWHGTWDDYAINAVFLENYWNDGSLKRQERWFDDFVIGTAPIGPLTARRPVTVLRTAPPQIAAWELQVTSDPDGKDIVWQSHPVDGGLLSLEISQKTGDFLGSRAGVHTLATHTIHWLRVRPVGQPDWSPWHMAFR
jgi:hypothetical protein